MADLRKVVEILISSKNQAGPGLKQATDQVKNFEKVVAGAQNLLGGLVAGISVAGIATFIKGQIDAADAVRDFSQRTGLAIETVSEYKYIADQTGTSLQTLAQANKILVGNAADAARGNEEASRKFRDLGISVTDANGKLKTSNELLLDVSRSLQGLPEQVQIDVASNLLGRQGVELLEFLRLGPEKIREMSAAAREKGFIVTPEEAALADEFNDTLTDLKTSVGALGRTVGVALAPAIQEVVEGLSEAIQKTREWAQEHPRLSRDVSELVVALGGAAGLVAILGLLGAAYRSVQGAAVAAWAAATSPVGAAILAVGALVGAVGLLVETYKEQERLQKNLERFGRGPVTVTRADTPTGGDIPEGFAKVIVEGKEMLVTLEEMNRLIGQGKVQWSGAAQAAGAAATAVVDLEGDLKKVNEEIAKFLLPQKLREAQVELAKLRRMPEDMRLLQREAERAAQEVIDRTLRDVENLKGVRPAPSPLRPNPIDRAEEARRIPQPDPIQTVPPPEDNPFLQQLEDMKAALTDFAFFATDQFFMVADSISNEFAAALGLTESRFKDLGDFIVTTMKQVAASIAGAILQLVALNAAIALVTGGPFNPFKGIRDLFGLNKGAIAGAQHGVIATGAAGTDRVGPVMLTRGELVTPAPMTARLDRFLNDVSEGAQGSFGRSFVVENLNISSTFGGHHERLEIARQVQRAFRELEGEYA